MKKSLFIMIMISTSALSFAKVVDDITPENITCHGNPITRTSSVTDIQKICKWSSCTPVPIDKEYSESGCIVKKVTTKSSRYVRGSNWGNSNALGSNMTKHARPPLTITVQQLVNFKDDKNQSLTCYFIDDKMERCKIDKIDN